MDDDPTVTVLVGRILSSQGHDVRVFTSGEALLEAVADTGLDLICLDLSLPGIDGLETLERLNSGGVTIPVILFTASASEIADRARAAGAVACVSKTGGWAELRTAVQAALEGRSPQDE